MGDVDQARSLLNELTSKTSIQDNAAATAADNVMMESNLASGSQHTSSQEIGHSAFKFRQVHEGPLSHKEGPLSHKEGPLSHKEVDLQP